MLFAYVGYTNDTTMLLRQSLFHSLSETIPYLPIYSGFGMVAPYQVCSVAVWCSQNGLSAFCFFWYTLFCFLHIVWILYNINAFVHTVHTYLEEA